MFAFSLIIALSASFTTLQISPARIGSAQDAKVKQDGFIAGCSETVIEGRSNLDLYAFDARSETPIKVGDALGVAMYAYARKQ